MAAQTLGRNAWLESELAKNLRLLTRVADAGDEAPIVRAGALSGLGVLAGRALDGGWREVLVPRETVTISVNDGISREIDYGDVLYKAVKLISEMSGYTQAKLRRPAFVGLILCAAHPQAERPLLSVVENPNDYTSEEVEVAVDALRKHHPRGRREYGA